MRLVSAGGRGRPEGGRAGVLEQQKAAHSQGGKSVGRVVENEVSFHLFNITSP